MPSFPRCGIALIEQPFPADADEVLENLDHPIPICTDESCHTTADLRRLKNRYEVINVKLNKILFKNKDDQFRTIAVDKPNG